MKKRIISMLLAVCMVVACTLAITPAVSAVDYDVEIKSIGSVCAGIGEIVEVPVKIAKDVDEIWELKIEFPLSDAYELIEDDIADGDSLPVYAKGPDGKGNYAIMITDTGTTDNSSYAENDTVVTLHFKVNFTSTLNIKLDESIKTLNDQGDTEPLTVNTAPISIALNATCNLNDYKVSEYAYDTYLLEAQKSLSASSSGTSFQKKYNNGKACNVTTYSYVLTSNNNYSKAYFDASSLEIISGVYDEFACLEENVVLTAGEVGGTGGKKASFDWYKVDAKVLPELTDAYFDADIEQFDDTVFLEYLLATPNLYFMGKYDELPASFVIEEEYSPALDVIARFAADELGSVFTWKGSNLWNYLHSDDVVAYCGAETADDFAFAPLDSFAPIGYQGPAEVTGKKFRVDSAIKYADMEFDVDGVPTHVYEKATCDVIAQQYNASGEKAGKAKGFSKDIGTVYKSLSDVNGVAVPTCDGYYFSALAITDLPELQEGEKIEFTFTNTVENIFGGKTTSEPVTLTYHADGTID